ncbi:formate/nitrite transporter family protein [Clostridium baratii]|uniref:formate/nitrite transporter family protein n=1 Tax=Clostridium baratii TaxID=1561 RepID=UPI001C024230|nr:formate/nitrite transporter family protein [Clostridium baratii]MBT9832635.1 nitrite transporter NirC [Clostridium baratii]MDU1856231.1 formate/nitrite transporter family protein [Clostridium baratii]STA99438.1 formate/nitrite transporter [Clostridium baratii]
MFKDEVQAVAKAGKNKVSLLRNNKMGYMVSSVLAGLYIGLGIMLIFSIGGILTSSGSGATKIVMGASFGVALSLVIFAGAELFTGNNFVMALSSLEGEVSWIDTLKIWVAAFIGNLIGSLIGAWAFVVAGLANGSVGEFIAKTSVAKMSAGVPELFMRGVLCNILVCLAVWCSIKLKSEIGKLVMVFWCLYVFITAGFEHSVANMTLLAIGLFSSHSAAITVSGFIYNIGIVTLGNIVGGVLLAVSYHIISRNKEK